MSHLNQQLVSRNPLNWLDHQITQSLFLFVLTHVLLLDWRQKKKVWEKVFRMSGFKIRSVLNFTDAATRWRSGSTVRISNWHEAPWGSGLFSIIHLFLVTQNSSHNCLLCCIHSTLRFKGLILFFFFMSSRRITVQKPQCKNLFSFQQLLPLQVESAPFSWGVPSFKLLLWLSATRFWNTSWCQFLWK